MVGAVCVNTMRYVAVFYAVICSLEYSGDHILLCIPILVKPGFPADFLYRKLLKESLLWGERTGLLLPFLVIISFS
jgi:hypothetical protein